MHEIPSASAARCNLLKKEDGDWLSMATATSGESVAASPIWSTAQTNGDSIFNPAKVLELTAFLQRK
jgi:hypothetical protein